MVESSLIAVLILVAIAIVFAIGTVWRQKGARAPMERGIGGLGSTDRSAPRSAAASQPDAVGTLRPGAPMPAAAPPRGVKRIFLSYRREDSADVAGRIYDRLTQTFDKAQVFKDVDSIPLGVDFRKHLQETVGRCDVLLAVVGDRWLTAANAAGLRRIDDPKDFVRIELEAALQRDIPVIPLLVRGATVPQEADLPPALAALTYRNGIAVRPDPDFHRDMDRLIRSLQTYVTGTPSPM